VTYATLMVHLELGRPHAGLLQIAGDLAQQLHAGVIGIAACQPLQIVYGDGYVSGDLVNQDREEIENEVKEAEAGFRSALQTRVKTLEWRSTGTAALLSDYLARETRSADLLITGVASGASVDAARRVNTGDLVMQVGRPVLIVPAARQAETGAGGMTRPASVSFLGSEFDDFLFAPIGEDRNGMQLSVLSALVRLDIDPWQEAAKLARLPGGTGTQRLASLIAALPDGPFVHQDLGTTVARLIALLPRRANWLLQIESWLVVAQH
jgi:hypothetical protein